MKVSLSRNDPIEMGSARALACSVTRPRGTGRGVVLAKLLGESQKREPTGGRPLEHAGARVLPKTDCIVPAKSSVAEWVTVAS